MTHATNVLLLVFGLILLSNTAAAAKAEKKEKSAKKEAKKGKMPITDTADCLNPQCPADEYTIFRKDDQAGLLHALRMMDQATSKDMADATVPKNEMDLVVAYTKEEFSLVDDDAPPPDGVDEESWEQFREETQIARDELNWDKISTEFAYRDPYEGYDDDFDSESPLVGRRYLHDGRVLDAATGRELVTEECVTSVIQLAISSIRLGMILVGVFRGPAAGVAERAVSGNAIKLTSHMRRQGASVSNIVLARNALRRSREISKFIAKLLKLFSVRNLIEFIRDELDWFDYIQIGVSVTLGIALFAASAGLSFVVKLVELTLEILTIVEYVGDLRDDCELIDVGDCFDSERLCEFRLDLRAGNVGNDETAVVRVRNRVGGSSTSTLEVSDFGTYRFEGLGYCLDKDVSCGDALDLQINVLEGSIEMRKWTIIDIHGTERGTQGCFDLGSCGGNTLLHECNSQSSGGVVLGKHMIYSTENQDCSSCEGDPNFKLCDQTLQLRARSWQRSFSVVQVEVDPGLVNRGEVIPIPGAKDSGTVSDYGTYNFDLKFCLRRGVPCDTVPLGTISTHPSTPIEIRDVRWVHDSNEHTFHTKGCYNVLTETTSCGGSTLEHECGNDEAGGIVIPGGKHYHPGQGYCQDV